MDRNFEYWVLLTLFSLVNLTALNNAFEVGRSTDWSSEQKWVISVAAVSLILSFMACACQLVVHERFCGKRPEGFLVLVVLIMWCAGLPTLMDWKHHDFAVTLYVSSLNANVFFSGWAALIVAMILATKHFEIMCKREDNKHLYHWVGFATASIIMMADTSRFWRDDCKDNGGDDETCNRTMFGFILGAISFVVGMVMAGLDIPLRLAQYTSMVFVLAWCFGVAYITFDEGPGAGVGTIYFAAWAALLFALCIASPALLEIVHNMLEAVSTEPITEGEVDVSAAKESPAADKVAGEEVEEEEVAETGEKAEAV